MRYPTTALGERNGAVRALQMGLHRALAAKHLPHVNLCNGTYGSKTAQDVNRFKSAYGIKPVQGKDFGGDGEWKALEPFLGKHDKAKLAARNVAIAAARARARALAIIAKAAARSTAVTACALKFYGLRPLYVYRQVRPMVGDLFDSVNHNRLDCSSSVTLIYKESGCPDPNGLGYNGTGWTGTLWPRGDFVTGEIKPGDLCFYGHQYPGDVPSHVAIAINSSEVVSFGHTPIIRAPIRYRNDFRAAKRYPLK